MGLVQLGGPRLMDDPAVAEHEHPVSQTKHLRHLAGDQQDANARVGQSANERVELGAGTDIDTAGRLVEQQQPAAVQKPPADDDLLLVAAGEGDDPTPGIVWPNVKRAHLLVSRLSAPAGG